MLHCLARPIRAVGSRQLRKREGFSQERQRRWRRCSRRCCLLHRMLQITAAPWPSLLLLSWRSLQRRFGFCVDDAVVDDDVKDVLCNDTIHGSLLPWEAIISRPSRAGSKASLGDMQRLTLSDRSCTYARPMVPPHPMVTGYCSESRSCHV
jgi:hypothetical protein